MPMETVVILADKGSAAYNFGNSPIGAGLCLLVMILIGVGVSHILRRRK